MRGLRLQLASLFLLAILPGLAAVGAYNYLQYRDTRAAEAARLLARAQLFAAPNGVLLNGIASMLRDLAKRPEIREAAREAGACGKILTNIDDMHPEVDHIAVFTTSGKLICADVGGLAVDERLAPWFEHVMAKQQFAIGEYRPAGPKGKGEIEAGYPVLRSDGTPIAVIGAGIDIGWLTNRFAQLALEQETVLTLFDRNGTALARYPDPDRLTGHRLALVAARIASGTERLDETEFLDGTTRVAAFAPLGGTEWRDLTISVDIDPSELLASARWNLTLDLASLSSVVLVGAFAAFYWGGKLFIRPIVEIGRTADRLSAGDMDARVGGPYRADELGRVARAFDAMAETLCTRDHELRRANAYKSRVLAIAGHDLRQPLQVIAMAHDLIGRALSSPRLRQQLERADQAIDRLLRQLDIIATAGRLDEHALEPVLEPVPLAPLVAEAVAEHASLAEAKGIALKAVASSAVVTTDREMLATILRNLVGNAVKYTHRGGVLVGCRRRGDAIALDISDTGIGIAEGQRAAVFDEFYQVDPKGAGMGLGLSIVKRTADALGHRLELRSAPGRGSRFRLVIPRAESRPAMERARSA